MISCHGCGMMKKDSVPVCDLNLWGVFFPLMCRGAVWPEWRLLTFDPELLDDFTVSLPEQMQQWSLESLKNRSRMFKKGLSFDNQAGFNIKTDAVDLLLYSVSHIKYNINVIQCHVDQRILLSWRLTALFSSRDTHYRALCRKQTRFLHYILEISLFLIKAQKHVLARSLL